VAILTYSFWQRVFGGDASALSQSLSVNGTPAMIIGVTARATGGTKLHRNPNHPQPFSIIAAFH
jgi:hypothetical protein